MGSRSTTTRASVTLRVRARPPDGPPTRSRKARSRSPSNGAAKETEPSARRWRATGKADAADAAEGRADSARTKAADHRKAHHPRGIIQRLCDIQAIVHGKEIG